MTMGFDAQLLDGLTAAYTIKELREACLRLEVDDEELAGGSKGELARELIGHMRRRGRLDELIAFLRADRPYISWPDWELRSTSTDGARVKVEVGNVLEFACDILVLKYAQEFWGADLAVVNVLTPGVWDRFAWK
jgi:hypothetical protein